MDPRKKSIWEESYEFWVNQSNGEIPKYRLHQIESLLPILDKHFKFNKIKCIETGASHTFKNDGALGLMFAKACNLTEGEFHSVDLDEKVINNSKKFYENYKLNVKSHLQDSVEFLNNTDFISNIVHLDSWDVDLKNPIPCALHGWKEFVAIEDKMSIGSILIVDDNWFGGTFVEWVYPHNPTERIDITYPILGKGALIWHHIKDCKSNWVKLSEDIIGGNVKLVYKKYKQ